MHCAVFEDCKAGCRRACSTRFLNHCLILIGIRNLGQCWWILSRSAHARDFCLGYLLWKSISLWFQGLRRIVEAWIKEGEFPFQLGSICASSHNSRQSQLSLRVNKVLGLPNLSQTLCRIPSQLLSTLSALTPNTSWQHLRSLKPLLSEQTLS